ncbi:uncharacterized protein LOC132628673 [Lycium barbarum]|uniref:uncharacterized protein LOC132628673 n=1 Tax=Lycium barbarum TaxID=112863 RepID=UPI00293ED012|nr:uncharacterized protein LOC132628673 [Lycium barbarum]
MIKLDPKAPKWFINKPPINWSRDVFSSFTKCDMLLNNMCESFNSVLLVARDKRILTMLESIRMYMMSSVVFEVSSIISESGASMQSSSSFVSSKIIKQRNQETTQPKEQLMRSAFLSAEIDKHSREDTGSFLIQKGGKQYVPTSSYERRFLKPAKEEERDHKLSRK